MVESSLEILTGNISPSPNGVLLKTSQSAFFEARYIVTVLLSWSLPTTKRGTPLLSVRMEPPAKGDFPNFFCCPLYTFNLTEVEKLPVLERLNSYTESTTCLSSSSRIFSINPLENLSTTLPLVF